MPGPATPDDRTGGALSTRRSTMRAPHRWPSPSTEWRGWAPPAAAVAASPALHPPGDPRALSGTLAASSSPAASPALSTSSSSTPLPPRRRGRERPPPPPRRVLCRWRGWPPAAAGALTAAVPGHDATERALPVVDGEAAPFHKYKPASALSQSRTFHIITSGGTSGARNATKKPTDDSTPFICSKCGCKRLRNRYKLSFTGAEDTTEAHFFCYDEAL